MLTKGKVEIGLEWRFGPEWPGQRCGAKTRKAVECQRPANKKKGRCRLHGVGSTGPKTNERRARISEANLRHGRYTKDIIRYWQPPLLNFIVWYLCATKHITGSQTMLFNDNIDHCPDR